MAEGGDDLEKTEEPTSKKIEDAVKKGQVAFSREVSNFLIFVTFALVIIWFLPSSGRELIDFMSRYISSSHDVQLNYENTDEFLGGIAVETAAIFSIPIILTVIAAFFSSFIQNGFVFSTESIMPKLEKISVIAGVKRLFSMKSFMDFLKGLFKISIVSVSSYLVFYNEIQEIIYSSKLSDIGIIKLMGDIAFKIVLAATVLIFIIAIVDYLYQKYEYLKNLRMTKQEVKEEFKQTEGNPQIKAKLKQIREEKARKRMVQKVPDSDVVIRNPTHYAIALEYKQDEMTAPIITAIGKDMVALRIIDIAEENEVPVVTNRPLAKALYETAELDEEIPLEHYKAVAEVIAYIYKLKNKAA